MIRKQRDEFVCTCDVCEESKVYGGTEDSFRGFVDYVKGQDWKITKDGEEWVHTCPDCREEE